MIYETQEDAEQDLLNWQRILRLQQWILEINIKRLKDMEADDANAEITYDRYHLCGVINLRDSLDYSGFMNDDPQDHERSMVHELLHLHIDPITEASGGEDATLQCEQAINLIAAALVRVKRGNV